MRSNREYKQVDINKIINYHENPRHEIGVNEIDTLKKLIEKVGSQYMFNLAKDIYLNGLLGSNLPVLVFNAEFGKFVVYEGNRRVACLKFLKNPSILLTIDKSFMSKIENLQRNEQGDILTKIYCYVTDEEDAFLIMERTHSGEDQGRGIKAWTPREKGVFQKRQKQKNAVALTIAELTEKYLNEDITKKLQYTTIQRFFNNKEVKRSLQLDNHSATVLPKETIILINHLIDKSLEETKKVGISITRLFNRSKEIEDFFLPLISEYNQKTDSSSQPDGVATGNEEGNENGKEDTNKERNKEQNTLRISIAKDMNIVYYTNQTIDLNNYIQISNKDQFDPTLLEINCESLHVADSIVQPNNHPGQYNIVYKYYMDNNKNIVYWQDNLAIGIKLKKSISIIEPQQTVLLKAFVDKYSDQLVFEHSDKIKSLMHFLSTESKIGNYSFFINIVSRMFLEYTFRLYANKVLKDDKQSIEDRSTSLRGLIDYCCNKIEQSNPRDFVKHVRQARKDSTDKVELLQKSVHYFDVTISNDDIQVMFKNLSIYLETVYDQLLKETLNLSV